MPRNIDMDLLRSFVAIVDTGSFTAAARRVDRTQSAISLQMKRLEEMLGARLFERRGRGVDTTDAGNQLLGDARAILAINDRLLGRMGRDPLHGEVTVEATEDFLAGPLAGILGRFRRLHAGVCVAVRTEPGDDADLRFVPVGESDPAVVWREPTLWLLPENGWDGVSPPHPLPLAIDGVRPGGLDGMAIDALDSAGIAWRPAVRSASRAAQMAAVHSGIAVAVMPRSAAASGRAVAGPAHGLPTLPTRAIAMRTSPTPTPAAQRLSEFVSDALARAG